MKAAGQEGGGGGSRCAFTSRWKPLTSSPCSIVSMILIRLGCARLSPWPKVIMDRVRMLAPSTVIAMGLAM